MYSDLNSNKLTIKTSINAREIPTEKERVRKIFLMVCLRGTFINDVHICINEWI